MTHFTHRGPACWQSLLVALLLTGSLTWPVCAQPADGDELEPYRLGIGFYERERYRQSAESLEQFLKASPRHPKAENARFVLGLAQVRLDDFPTAHETFRRFIKDHPQAKRLSQARYWQGHCSFHQQDFATAETELSAFVKDFPQDPYQEHALSYLGEAQLKRGKPEPALASFNRSLEKFPQGAMAADAAYGRARALEALKKLPEAESAYRQIADDKQNEFAADARMGLGTLLFEQQKYPQSAVEFAAYDSQFPEGPQRAQACLNQGFALYESGDYAGSEVPLRRATEMPTVAADASLWLGLALKKQQKLRPAVEWLEGAYARHRAKPQAEQMLFQWGDALLRLGESDSARARFEQVLADWPQGQLREESLNAATVCAVNAGQLDDAETLAQRYQGEFPQGRLRLRQTILKGRVRLLRGAAAAREGDAARAKGLYSEAAGIFAGVAQGSEIESTQQQARFYWGESLLKLADYPQVLKVSAPLAAVVERETRPGDFVEVLLQRGLAHLELARQRSRASAATAPTPADRAALEADCLGAREASTSYLKRAPQGSLAAQAWYIAAVAAALAGDKEGSLAALETLARQHARQPEREIALLEVAGIAYAREDYALAETLNAELVSISTDGGRRPQALAELGWSRSQQKKYAEALEAFRSLLKEAPDHSLAPEAAFMVGQSLAGQGKKREAQQAFAAAFARPGDSDHLFQSGWRSGRLLFELQEPDQADAAYKSLLGRFPGHPRADRALDEWATQHYDAQRFERADELFRRLAEEYPDSPLSWNARLILAESELIADRPQSARTRFLEIADAPSADPKSAERALYQLQNIAQELQDWRELIQWCDRSAKQFPEGTYRQETELARAEADFMQQDYAAAVVRLEQLRGMKGDPAVADRPWFSKVFVRLAESLVRQKEYDRASAVVEELQTWNPESPLLYQAYEIQGRACKNQARFAEARQWFLKCIEDPLGRKTETAARAQLLLADTYVLEEKFETALDEYLKVEIGYEYPYWQAAALFHAGTCQESLRDATGARKTYTRLLTSFPDSEFAPRAKERLAAVRKTSAPAKP